MKTAAEIIRETQEALRDHESAGMTPDARAQLIASLDRLSPSAVEPSVWGTERHLARKLAIEYIYQLGRRDMMADVRQGMVSMPAVTYVP